MAERVARDAVVIEEAPSNRPELLVRLPAREPLGSLSPAMGGLGFALPAAIGLRMARPNRPVVAIVGDGSSLYAIQSLWSAAHYGVGALFVILSNGGYAIMDRLAEQHGGRPPWPGFGVDVAGLARAFGCPAQTIDEYDELVRTFDEVLPGLGSRDRAASPGGRRCPRPTFVAVKAALMREYHRPLELVERPMPEVAEPTDVLVRIGGAGVCATDLHAIEGLMEPAGVTLPRVLGHENAGLGGRARRRGLDRGRRATQCSSTRPTAAASVSPAVAATTCTASGTSSPVCPSTAASRSTCSSRSARSCALPDGVEPAAVAPHADAGLDRLSRGQAARASRRSRLDRRRRSVWAASATSRSSSCASWERAR